MTAHTIKIEPDAEILERLDALQGAVDRLTAAIEAQDTLWTVKQVATYRGVSEDTVRRWVRQGKIEVAQRTGKKIMFDPKEVRED